MRDSFAVGLSGVLLLGTLAGCAGSSPRFTSSGPAAGRQDDTAGHQLEGVASYYADEFHGRTTANGEVFDMNAMTAAHRTLPFGTVVRVTNIESGASVVIRINDRGPFKDDRVIDLSYVAARQLGMISKGTVRVRLKIVDSEQISPP